MNEMSRAELLAAVNALELFSQFYVETLRGDQYSAKMRQMIASADTLRVFVLNNTSNDKKDTTHD